MWNLSGSLCFQKTRNFSLLNSPSPCVVISNASIADFALNSTNASAIGLCNVWMPLKDTHKATSCVAPTTKCWPGPTDYKFVVPTLWLEHITNTPYILNNSLWWWGPRPLYKNASKDSQEFHFWNPAQYGI